MVQNYPERELTNLFSIHKLQEIDELLDGLHGKMLTSILVYGRLLNIWARSLEMSKVTSKLLDRRTSRMFVLQ